MTDERLALIMGALHRMIGETMYSDELASLDENYEDWFNFQLAKIMDFTGGDFALCETPEQIEAYFNAQDGEMLQ